MHREGARSHGGQPTQAGCIELEKNRRHNDSDQGGPGSPAEGGGLRGRRECARSMASPSMKRSEEALKAAKKD